MADKTQTATEKALAEALALVAKLQAEKLEAATVGVKFTKSPDGKVKVRGMKGAPGLYGMTWNGTLYESLRQGFESGTIQREVAKLGKLSMSVEEAAAMEVAYSLSNPVEYSAHLAKKAKWAKKED